MKQSKIILFGGSFNPIHRGHVTVARRVFKQLAADAMIFVPARQSPHKTEQPVAGQHRLEMIRLAIAEEAAFSVSECELNRPVPSYTLQTVDYFREKLGAEARIHWLIGADQLDDFGKWYRVKDLLDACQVVVMYRASYPKPTFDRFSRIFTPEQVRSLSENVVETPLIPISSTEIRQHLAAGTLPDDWLPEPVYAYIRKHHLYGY